MSRMVQVDEWYLQDLADAIRAKANTDKKMLISDMAPTIDNLPFNGAGDDIVGESMRKVFLRHEDAGGDGAITLILPSNAYRIPTSMFKSNGTIGEVMFENNSAPNFNYIGQEAFSSNNFLRTFHFPPSTNNIDLGAFRYCSNFNVDKLPDNLQYMGNHVFRDCTNLTISELPPKLTTIPDGTFRGCTRLNITTVPEGITSIGSYGLDSACMPGTTRELLTLPSTLQSIASQGCANQNFKKIRFMGTPSQTGIASTAFSYSQPLTDIYVPWGYSSVVLNAPWGATNATIHYNTAPDEVIE